MYVNSFFYSSMIYIHIMNHQHQYDELGINGGPMRSKLSSFVDWKKRFRHEIPYLRCKAEAAWNENDSQRFAKCTEEISQAHPWLFTAMPNINKFSAINHNATTPIEIQIEEALEEVFKDPYESNGLKTALAFIKSQAELFESFTSCSEIIGKYLSEALIFASTT